MELGSIAAVVGAAVALTGMVGGLLMKAFVTPIKTRTDGNHTSIKDHEDRLRSLENKVNTHSIQMDNVLKAVDQLVTKIDLLIAREYRPRNEGE